MIRFVLVSYLALWWFCIGCAMGGLANVWIVIDDEDAMRHGNQDSNPRRGRSISNIAPPVSRLKARIVPLCARTISRVTNKPSPSPP